MTDSDSSLLRFPRLYTIHSQKGGVGKTGIALAIAGLAAFGDKKKTLIVDADMTGTSLAEADPPPDGASEDEQARLLLSSDKNKKYFNDLVFAIPRDFTSYTPIHVSNARTEAQKALEPFLWEIDGSDGMVFVMPGNSSAQAVQCAVPFLSQEYHVHFFRHRLEKIIASSILAGFEVVIVDHSPGLYGISKSSFTTVLDQLCHHEPIPTNENVDNPLEEDSRLDSLIRAACPDCWKERGGSFLGQSILVTTQDAVDCRAILPSSYFCIKEHEIVLKKAKASRLPLVDIFGFLERIIMESSKDFIKTGWFSMDIAFNKFQVEIDKVFDPALIIPALLKDIAVEKQTGSNEKEKERKKQEKKEIKILEKYFVGRLKVHGAGAGEYLEDFGLSKIISAVKYMTSTETPGWMVDKGRWQHWLEFVGGLTGLKLPQDQTKLPHPGKAATL